MAEELIKPNRWRSHLTAAERLAYYTIPEPMTGCWLCWAAPGRKGYANVRIGNKMRRAHRVAWEIENGPIPDGLQVCHRCDTPACVNPIHLFLGTNRDNALDCVAKGRGLKGRPNPHTRGEAARKAKITSEIARAIFNAPGRPIDIAKRFGVTGNHVVLIKRRTIWKHVNT